MNRLLVLDRRDWLRLLGGLLFATGAVVLFIRKAIETPAGGDPWGDFALLLVLLVPFLVLYGLGMAARAGGPEAEPWQAVYLVFAVILAPFVLLQFLEWVGGDTDSNLNLAWILAVTAALGAAAAVLAGATVAGGFGALAGILAWLFFWNEVLEDPSTDSFRWLLIIIAAIYLAAVFLLRAWPRAPKLSGLVTAAGLAAITAALIGNVEPLGGLIAEGLGGLVEPDEPEAEPGLGWDLFLLIVSGALIAFSARSGRRGPGLVGGFGLLAFIIVVGSDLDALVDGDAEGALVGWPLVLLLVGAAGLAVSFGTLGGMLWGGPGDGAPGGPGAAAGPPAAPEPPPEPPPPREPPPAA
jgi:hypothetical protein